MENKKPSSAKASDGKRKKELNIEDFKKQLKECQKQKEEYLAGWQRSRADFLNYQKEKMERIGEILKYGKVELVLKILPILDNFEIVEKKISPSLKNDGNIKGLLQIKTQLSDFLKNQGVEEIKTIGQKFDPNFQEVVEEVEPSSAKASVGKKVEPGIVIEEMQKGYLLHDKVLRPAKVRVSKQRSEN